MHVLDRKSPETRQGQATPRFTHILATMIPSTVQFIRSLIIRSTREPQRLADKEGGFKDKNLNSLNGNKNSTYC